MHYSNFEEVDQEVMNLYGEKRYEEAVNLLESVVDQFPDNLYTITWDMVVIYSQMTPKQPEKVMDILEHGNKKGLWYNLTSKMWNEYKESSRFQNLLKLNTERKEKAQEEAEAKYQVYLPENYSEDKSYPLHIAIHGWGEDMYFYRKFWTSDILSKECISLFIQSSRVANPIGFCWDDLELARKEIKDTYDQVLDQYPVDMGSITTGGFSQGATMAMDFALNNMIPVKGFIALCPDQPEGFSKESVQAMMERNIKGIILTGEKDGCLPEQKEMVKVLEEKGFSHRFVINKGLGHWFPDNISEQIDDALDYIGK